MNLKSLILGDLSTLSGGAALIHHKIVARVWMSSNQTWYECHGKMGAITMSFGIIMMILLSIWNKGVRIA